MQNTLNKVKFRYVDSSRYDVDWHSTMHSHAFTELFYVVQGCGSFKFGDELMPVTQDDMVIINPNIMHTEISDTNDPLEYIVLGIEGIEFLSNENNLGHSMHNYVEYKHEILFYLKSVVDEVSRNEMFNEQIVDYLLKILVMNIIRRTVSGLRVHQGDRNINKDCVFVENYINIHYRENITLDKLADLTFLNKYYLSHEFKRYSGYSPIEFVLNKRLTKAKKLLETTDLSVTQISEITGFGSASYFSQYFKKLIKLSPSQYRQSFKK
ncbi:MAG: AraC family transcriptional regulator [Erysipelothrix sp.]|nr:AraC family transcriptional regulator [Erysipelothrix sp.]